MNSAPATKRLRRLLSPAAVCLCLLLGAIACSDPGPECSAGATLKDDGTCTAAKAGPSCGEGTTLVDGKCQAAVLPDAATLSCSDGTALTEAGFCVFDTANPQPAVCGEGTVELDGGLCGLPEPDPVPTCDPACAPGYYCDEVLVCQALPRSAAWACNPIDYNNGLACDCSCGEPDPDCARPDLPVRGCASGQCQANGLCVACTPDCTGKVCGDDGCGGNCGECLVPGYALCVAGACAACTPDCTDKHCGDDGCGGSCGDCTIGTRCEFGSCLPPGPDESCANFCGFSAPAGCACTASCSSLGTCCIDVHICGCIPDCSNKNCGDNGCGGLCGFCEMGQACGAEQRCIDDPCEPDPCSAYGSCQAVTGACQCEQGYKGTTCDTCASGYTGYPDCVQDDCLITQVDCGDHGICQPEGGGCRCDPGFGGELCDRCDADGGRVYPNCAPEEG